MDEVQAGAFAAVGNCRLEAVDDQAWGARGR